MWYSLRYTIGILGIFIGSACVLAAPPRYVGEPLDTGQFAAPSEHLPAGGFLSAAAFISPNGRYVVTGVTDNDRPFGAVPDFLAVLDREAGTSTLLTGFASPFPFGINDNGAVALRAQRSAQDLAREMYYWSPATGIIAFGDVSLPAQLVSHGGGVGTPRILNNLGQVLVQTANDDQNVLWDPVAGTQTPIGRDWDGAGEINAVSLNNLGQVVGGVVFPPGATGGTDVRPFIWDATGGLRILFDLELIVPPMGFRPSGRFAAADAINDAGVIGGETWDENAVLQGLHWDSEATVPTLLPCPDAEPSQAARRCAVWMLDGAGQPVGGEERDEVIAAHVIWDGTEPYLLRDLVADGLGPCQVWAVANDGTLSASCNGALTLLIPVASGPALDVSTPVPGEALPAGTVQVAGTATDDVEVVRVTVNGNVAVLEPSGNPDDANEISFTVSLALAPGDQTIEVVATDSDGNVATVSLNVFVFDPDTQGPVVSDVLADPNPVPINTPVHLSAEIDDTGTGGSAIAGAEYRIDGMVAAGMAAEDGAFDETRESVVADIPGFAEPGVYEVCVTGEDQAGNWSAPACAYIAVFDPDGGFVTGGGWIDVPAGSYGPDALLSGKANFGFVAKYKKADATPVGSTEFQFHAGGLNFHSSGYDWLVVSESDITAYLAGTGTVNGAMAPNGTPYRFMLTARDGNPDTFGMRIWWQSAAGQNLVIDAGATTLGGGSIVIHARGK